MSQLDEAIKRWDVVRFLRRHGHEVRLTETGEAHARCPRCHDSKYRLYINRRTKNWICFNCMRKGRGAISYIRFFLGCEEPQAMRELVETMSGAMRRIADDYDEPEKPTAAEVPLPDGFRNLKLPADERSQPFWDYLIGRSISPSMVRKYEIGYCRRKPYRDRIVVPINVFGVRRGWVARTISDEVKRKYLNPSGVHTSRLLFNIDNVVENSPDRVVLVEGVFDALRMPDVMACTFGKKISIQQVEILGEAGFRKLVFCYDGDAIADAEHHIRETIPLSMQCYRAKLPPEYDPGNAPMTVLHRAIQDAELWNPGTV